MLLFNLLTETISIISFHSCNQICKINRKKTSKMSSLPALQLGILIPFKLASPLVSFDFVISYDSNVYRTNNTFWALLVRYVESFLLHFHFPVLTSELAVRQLRTDRGNMTRPVLMCVRAHCFSGTQKQKDHAAFTRALKQWAWDQVAQKMLR